MMIVKDTIKTLSSVVVVFAFLLMAALPLGGCSSGDQGGDTSSEQSSVNTSSDADQQDGQVNKVMKIQKS